MTKKASINVTELADFEIKPQEHTQSKFSKFFQEAPPFFRAAIYSAVSAAYPGEDWGDRPIEFLLSKQPGLGKAFGKEVQELNRAIAENKKLSQSLDGAEETATRLALTVRRRLENLGVLRSSEDIRLASDSLQETLSSETCGGGGVWLDIVTHIYAYVGAKLGASLKCYFDGKQRWKPAVNYETVVDALARLLEDVTDRMQRANIYLQDHIDDPIEDHPPNSSDSSLRRKLYITVSVLGIVLVGVAILLAYVLATRF